MKYVCGLTVPRAAGVRVWSSYRNLNQKEKSQIPDILHRVASKSSPNDTYRALITLEGLTGWWTTDTQGNCNVGGVIQFRFGDRAFIDMKVLELDPAKPCYGKWSMGPQIGSAQR